jgi:hypothetical protein
MIRETKETRARGQGMAIAAGIVVSAFGDTVIAKEILSAAGLETVDDMRKCGVDPYDVRLCRPALKEYLADKKWNERRAAEKAVA